MHPFPAGFLFPAKSPKAPALPPFADKVAAGFPSPTDDYIEKTLDLNELLVQNPPLPEWHFDSGDRF